MLTAALEFITIYPVTARPNLWLTSKSVPLENKSPFTITGLLSNGFEYKELKTLATFVLSSCTCLSLAMTWVYCCIYSPTISEWVNCTRVCARLINNVRRGALISIFQTDFQLIDKFKALLCKCCCVTFFLSQHC